MKRSFIIAAICGATLLTGASSLLAQTPLYTVPPKPWMARGGGPRLVSPEVLPDRRITFRLQARTAASVDLIVGTEYADQHTYSLTKGDDGIWTTTIGPVDPEIYPYSFRIGGASLGRGSVEVPGDTPAPYDVQNVPHGSSNTHIYYSKVRKSLRELTVYVPPQYYSEPKRAFPVVYNWGGGGNSRDATILDNLIAAKKAVPLIMVTIDTSGWDRMDAEAARVINGQEVQADIIPFMEAHYRVLPGRDNRAMVGISHNGGSAFTAGTMNLDKFAYLGLLSTGMFGGLLPSPTFTLYAPYEPDKLLPPLTKKLLTPGTKLKVFYLSSGTIDPRTPFIESAIGDFQKYGVKPIFEKFPGGHQDKAFRPAFIDFVSLLFK